MVKELIKKGAEAELTIQTTDSDTVVSKKRVAKKYRNPILDLKIRTKRTRSEAKIIKEAAKVVNVPKIIGVDEEKSEILMEQITGKQLKEVIERNPELCVEAGALIRKIHDLGIIHGDLTTSNILFADASLYKERIKQKGKLFFIDFGLGYFSKKVEDRATDLVVFKKTFNATHSGIKKGWKKVLEGYKPEKELCDRMKEIEKRARYH